MGREAMTPTVASRLGQSLAGRIQGSGGILGTRPGRLERSESKSLPFPLVRAGCRLSCAMRLTLCELEPSQLGPFLFCLCVPTDVARHHTIE